MKLITSALRHPVIVLVSVLAIAFFSYLSIRNSKIDIFPNPFVHYIEISSVEILQKPSFQLVDVLGRAVAVNLIELEKGKNWKIEIGSLASGNYWLTITNGIQQSSFSLNHVAN